MPAFASMTNEGVFFAAPSAPLRVARKCLQPAANRLSKIAEQRPPHIEQTIAITPHKQASTESKERARTRVRRNDEWLWLVRRAIDAGRLLPRVFARREITPSWRYFMR